MKKIVALLFLCGCTLHPKYVRDARPMASEWRTQVDDTYMQECIGFWKQFQDPVLDSLVNEALANNQDLKVAIYRVKEYEAMYGIVRSQLFPQLNGSGDAGRLKLSENFISTVPGIPFISNLFDLALNASYIVDIWGKVRSETESAYAEVLAQVEVRRMVIIGVVTGVLSTYVNMRQYDEQLRIAEETRDTRIESFNLANTRFQLGLDSEMQPDQAKSEVEAAQVKVDRLKNAIALEENLLCLLLGKPSEKPARGKTIAQLVLPLGEPAYLPANMVNQRPDVLKAEQELIAANADIGVARARFLPEFNLAASFGSQTSNLSNFFTSASSIWAYALSLMQEIFTGGKLTSQLKLANSTKMAMLHQYQGAILTGLKEINDALVSHKISRHLALDQKQRVDTLARYFQLATYQYKEGLTDYLTYLDAERHLFEAQIDAISALGYTFTTYISLFQSMGGPWVLSCETAL
mgnify:CR=1 FL=1